MSRALLLVLDSVGIGGAPDAARYGDAGASTLGHIRDWCARAGRPLHLPNLAALGLFDALALSEGREPGAPGGAIWGVAREASPGKDTTTGHWEIACAPPTRDFGLFPDATPAFPPALTEALIELGNLPGLLGDCHASGTEIIDRLGAEHVATGKPIVYTSADSVLQIAAHEEAFGLERLYALCRTARVIADRWQVGRVIARPFTGVPGAFRRTPNRRDFAMPPFTPTLLDDLSAQGRAVVAIGKVADIFAGRGVTQSRKAHGVTGTFEATMAAWHELTDGGLVFSNIVEFDSEFGHRRDPAGYADAMRELDALLPRLVASARPGDLIVLTADHGNDPTWPGSDHTREQVPVLAIAPGAVPGALGLLGFADIGATLGAHLGIAVSGPGRSFLSRLLTGQTA
ncbi:MAG: phosphopentomutase [Rhodobacteraceae bacterium]|nr:phosphopentomutase [Paracoccaceae bacterium]